MDCKEGEVPEDMQERNFEAYRDAARTAGVQPMTFTLYKRFRRQPPTFAGQRQLASAAMVEEEDEEESEPVCGVYLPMDGRVSGSEISIVITVIFLVLSTHAEARRLY
jgi:hypothetical protein